MTGLMIHVSQDLSTTNSNTVGTGKDGLGDMSTKLESGRHIGEKTSLMSQMDELDSVGKSELQNLSISKIPVE